VEELNSLLHDERLTVQNIESSLRNRIQENQILKEKLRKYSSASMARHRERNPYSSTNEDETRLELKEEERKLDSIIKENQSSKPRNHHKSSGFLDSGNFQLKREQVITAPFSNQFSRQEED
jgi:hypothetical protein